MNSTTSETRVYYNRKAFYYDKAMTLSDWFGLARWRRLVASQATGKTLEVAAGTGKNVVYYPRSIQLTLTDISPEMLAIAKAKAKQLGMQMKTQVMDSEQLKFPDKTFDTVISSLSLCSYINPIKALREMARVCKPGGQILLLEHGKSSRPWLGRLQDRFSNWYTEHYHCRWNRDPEALAQQAGLNVKRKERFLFGIGYFLETTYNSKKEE